MVVAVARNRKEFFGNTNGLVIGLAIIAAGVLLYFFSRMMPQKKST
jgi:hypothetical protein